MRWAFLFAKIVDICRNRAKKVGISRKIFACRKKSQMYFRWQIFLLPARPLGSQEFLFARAISGKKSPDSLLRGVGGKNTEAVCRLQGVETEKQGVRK